MSLSFTLLRALTDGNQIRVTEDGPAPAFIKLSVKIGANPVQTVSMTMSEAQELRTLLNAVVQARTIDQA